MSPESTPSIILEYSKSFEGAAWTRLFNPVIMSVFMRYNPESEHIFAVTGDIDHLGIYVARNGRPQAENLVDSYNQIARNAVGDWLNLHTEEVSSCAFIPSGEEAFIIGTTTSPQTAIDFFDQLPQTVNSAIVNQPYVSSSGTGITFGGIVLDHSLDRVITKMQEVVTTNLPDEIIVPIYLQVLTSIREQTARALDVNKFYDLFDGEHAVEARQIVFAQMLAYKENTAKLLAYLSSLPPTEVAHILEVAGDTYGLTPVQERTLCTFLRSLRNEPDS